MSEIEELRKDIEQAKEIMFRFYKQARQALGIGEMHDRLARLEAEAAEKADPWQKAKDGIEHALERYLFGSTAREIALYARNLEEANTEIYGDYLVAKDRIAELKSELAKRPVVWCNRLPEGDCLRDVSGHVKVYTDKEKNDCFLVRGRFEPYTGQQA